MSRSVKLDYIVPVYNPKPSELQRLMGSFQAQSDKEFNVILVDDGSIIPVRSMLESLELQNDISLSVFRNEENLGISNALNVGIKNSVSNYVAFVDQDDFVHGRANEIIRATIACNLKEVWFFTNEFLVDNKGNVGETQKNDFNRIELESGMYLGHLQIFKVSKLKNELHFNSEFDGSQDHELAIRLARKGYNAFLIKEHLYFWTYSENSVSHSNTIKNKTGANKISSKCVEASMKALNMHLTSGQFVNHKDTGVYFFRDESPEQVSIIVPTGAKRTRYRRKLYFESFIQSLRAQTGLDYWANYEVVAIVSRESDISPISKSLNRVNVKYKILVQSGDFNFSEKVDMGVRNASYSKLVIANDDIIINTKNVIASLFGFKNHYNLVVAGPIVLGNSSTIQSAGDRVGENSIHHIGDRINLKTALGARLLGTQREVSSVTGAFLAIDKRHYLVHGGFNKFLPSAYQDVVLCTKIKRSGGKLGVTPSAIVTHIEGVTRGKKLSPAEVNFTWTYLKRELSARDPLGYYAYRTPSAPPIFSALLRLAKRTNLRDIFSFLYLRTTSKFAIQRKKISEKYIEF